MRPAGSGSVTVFSKTVPRGHTSFRLKEEVRLLRHFNTGLMAVLAQRELEMASVWDVT